MSAGFVSASWERCGAPVPGPASATARLLIAGDTHGNLDWIGTLAKLAARLGCDGIVQLGDFGFWPDMKILRDEDRPTINNRWLTAVARTLALHGVWMRALDGNHDAHPLARSVYPSHEDGVRPLRDSILDWADRGAVWEWCGLRFGAMGGAISIDRQFRSAGRSFWSTEQITDADVEALTDRAGDERVDVLFTHDSPVLPPGFRPLSDPHLRLDVEHSQRQVMRCVDIVRPRLLIHGHFHHRYADVVDRPWGSFRIEGLASDGESHTVGASWCVLDLPTLEVSASLTR